MAQEVLLQDFRGGMDASTGVDKLDPTACLLADNVRLDEAGNVLSAGAMTAQNASALTDTAANTNIHSLYWNPSLGAVSGVGQDVFMGLMLGTQTDALKGANGNQQKMSFASAPSRVYFDVGSVGYWTDLTNLLTVDWAPPVAFSSLGGPTVTGSGVQTGVGVNWQVPGGIASTSTTTIASVGLLFAGSATSNQLRATMTTNSFAVTTSSAVTGVGVSMGVAAANTANAVSLKVTLLKAGVPVGTPKTLAMPTTTTTATFGSVSDLWGTTLAPADVNSGTFGFQVVAYMTSNPNQLVSLSVYNGVMTVFGGASGGMVAGTGGAGTLSGTYSWIVTFVDLANGEESGASPDTVGIVLSNQQGTLTSIPTGDARTGARNLYRKGGALTVHYLVGTINDNTSTTYSDNQSDVATLAEGVILPGDVQGDYPNTRLGSQNVRFPELHYDRLFWVIPGTNKIIWSKPLNGFAYPAVNQINVGNGNPVTRIVSKWGELIIFKNDGIWRLTGTDENSFTLSQTPSVVGTDLSFSVFGLPDGVRFANRWGHWIFNGYTSVPMSNRLDLWFKQDDRTNVSLFGLNGFHPPEVVSATVPVGYEMVGNADKLYWAYAEKGQTSNNAQLVIDVKRGNITKRSAGTLTNPLSLAIDPVTGYVYAGGSNGFIYLVDDWNGSTSTNLDFQSGYVDLQRGSNKALWALEFFINTNGQAITPYVYYDGGQASETLAPITTTSLTRVLRPCESLTARKLQNFSIRINGTVFPNANGTPLIQLVSVKPYFDLRVGRARTGQ